MPISFILARFNIKLKRSESVPDRSEAQRAFQEGAKSYLVLTGKSIDPGEVGVKALRAYGIMLAPVSTAQHATSGCQKTGLSFVDHWATCWHQRKKKQTPISSLFANMLTPSTAP